MRWLLIFAVASACYAPASPLGVPCSSPGDRCPAGQFCVNHVCRSEPGIDAPAADRDGDGVVDDRDNCPALANADQANEDADAFGDLCDGCPPFADAGTPDDRDADGVWDTCDPHPDVAGDRIALFEGFQAGIPASWSMLGAWTSAGGAVSVTLRANEPASLSPPLLQDPRSTTSAGFMITGNAGGARGMGVTAPTSPIWIEGLACIAFFDFASEDRSVGLVDVSTAGVVASKPMGWLDNVPHVAIERRDRTSYACTLRDESGESTVQGEFTDTPLGASIAIGARGVSGTFLWLMYVIHGA